MPKSRLLFNFIGTPSTQKTIGITGKATILFYRLLRSFFSWSEMVQETRKSGVDQISLDIGVIRRWVFHSMSMEYPNSGTLNMHKMMQWLTEAACWLP